MFLFLSKTLDVLLSPLTWALLALGVALAARWRKRARLSAVATAVALLVLYAFSIEPVSNALTRAIEVAPRPPRPGASWDAVVVLGGLLDADATEWSGAPTYNDASERLLAAFDLFRAGRATNVVLSSGAHGPTGASVEARVLADQIAAWGIARERIVVEDRSLNTRENALYTADIARARGWKTLLVVTSAAHVPRAAGCFAEVGLPVEMLPVDFHGGPLGFGGSWLPRAHALEYSTRAIREAAGRLVYRWRGWSK